MSPLCVRATAGAAEIAGKKVVLYTRTDTHNTIRCKKTVSVESTVFLDGRAHASSGGPGSPLETGRTHTGLGGNAIGVGRSVVGVAHSLLRRFAVRWQEPRAPSAWDHEFAAA